MVRSATVLSILAAASMAVAVETSTEAIAIPGAYIIEFDENQDATAFRRQAGMEFDTRLELNFELFKGISIQLPANQTAEEMAASFAALPSVKNIWPVRAVPAPNPEIQVIPQPASQLQRRQTHDNETAEHYPPHVMTQVDKMHAKGITGQGIKIAVIDSGVDYNHPLLGGCFGEGCLIESGYDFVGDKYTGLNTPTPDDDPMDCMGHGSHVTGIISARKNEWGFQGAAPNASIAMYRVFGCEGGAGEDVLIAAFNRAYDEGANIITASIGSYHGWSSEAWAMVVSRIVEKGVPCTVSAGNDGYLGLFRPQSPAVGKGVTAVAAFQNTVVPLVLFESYYATDDGLRVVFPYKSEVSDGFDNGNRQLWAVGQNLTGARDACEPLPDSTPDLSDFYVLVGRGECNYRTQAENVAAKGGRFFIVSDNQSVTQNSPMGLDGIEGIVAVGIVPEQIGETWLEALRAGSKVTAEFLKEEDTKRYIYTLPDGETRGAVSFLTSWGPSYEMEATPQVGAPGGNILSTYPLNLGGYAVISGTSMACPFAAASFALVAEARGSFDPGLLEGLLSATARPQLFQTVQNGKPQFNDYLSPPVQQGAGLIQVYDAAYSTTLIEPSSLSFNDTAHFAKMRSFTITNNGSEDVVYSISHVPTHSFLALRPDSITPNRYPVESFEEHANLVFSNAKVAVESGGSVNIDVVAEPPQGLDASRYPLWSGYIAVNASDGSSFSLSYYGLSGSLHDAVIMNDDAAQISVSSSGPLSPDETFTLPRPGIIPDPTESPTLQVIVNTNWGSAKITADLVSLANSTLNGEDTKSIGQLMGFPILWTVREYWRTNWYGQLTNGEYAPAGRYKVVVKALRIFGDESIEEDWIVSETEPFRIRYDQCKGVRADRH